MLRASFFSGLFFNLGACLILTMAPVQAAEQKVVKSDNPHIQKAQEKAVDIAKSFTPVEIENLAVIKDAFGILRAVQVTNRNVESAVKKCGKDNPDMKSDMDAAYSEWKTGIVPTLGAKENEMRTAVNDGRFSKPKEVTVFLDLLDKAAQYADDKMEKKIVTTPSACESLEKSMDKTGERLEQMLAELKFPVAVLKQKPDTVAPAAGTHD